MSRCTKIKQDFASNTGRNEWETVADWRETAVDWRRSEFRQKNSAPQEWKMRENPLAKIPPELGGILKTNSVDEAYRFSLNAARASPKAKNLLSYHTRAQHATCESIQISR